MLKINVLRNLGGSGGTIVGKALSACGAFVFSETNPRSATVLNLELNALVQLRRLAPAHVPAFWRTVDANALGSPPVFGAFMREVVDGFAAAGLPVVVRDHSYTDYIGVPFVWPEPTEASLDAALTPVAELQEIAVVRHPVSTFRSLRTHPHYHWCLDGPKFVEGALRFFTAFNGALNIRYEDFLTDPDVSLKRMCDHYDIDYVEDWKSRLNVALLGSGHPKALASSSIEAPEPRSEDWNNHLAEMRRSPRFEELMSLSGYDQAIETSTR